MMALLENSDHPDKQRAAELNELRKLALYELLKEKEERVNARKKKTVRSNKGCFGYSTSRNITIDDDTEELKHLLKTLGDPT